MEGSEGRASPKVNEGPVSKLDWVARSAITTVIDRKKGVPVCECVPVKRCSVRSASEGTNRSLGLSDHLMPGGKPGDFDKRGYQ